MQKNGNIICKNLSKIIVYFFVNFFLKGIKQICRKTKHKFQGQSLYQVTQKSKNKFLKKGDYFYLDNFHKDHIEVFDALGKAKGVLNLDGTHNIVKSELATKAGRLILRQLK